MAQTEQPPKPAVEKPEWYGRLSPEAKKDYDDWLADGGESFLDEDEGGAMVPPGKPKE